MLSKLQFVRELYPNLNEYGEVLLTFIMKLCTGKNTPALHSLHKEERDPGEPQLSCTFLAQDGAKVSIREDWEKLHPECFLP